LDEPLGLLGEVLSDTHRVVAAAADLLQRMDAARSAGNGARGASESGAVLRSALGRLEHAVAGLRPGFSSARTTTRYSGRGVGLDVVRSNLAQLRGSVTATFKPGDGTSFYLRVPASTAIRRLLLVRAGEATYGIPLDQVREVFHTAGCPATRCGSTQLLHVRGRVSPAGFSSNCVVYMSVRIVVSHCT
jgi:hypothetical protein